MSNVFDAYHKWLGIPPGEQPPHHYRLLGLGLFESDPDVIQAAADRQMSHVQTYKNGPQASLSQQLLNEISAAKLCLLKAPKKSAYDENLRRQLGTVATPASPASPASPSAANHVGANFADTAARPTARPPQAAVNPNGPNGLSSATSPGAPPFGGGPRPSASPTGSGRFPTTSPGSYNPAAPNNAPPNSATANSATQNATAHLAAGRTATVVRPPAAPATMAVSEEEPERSWAIPPAAAILAAASVVAVLLVIGIVLVLNSRGARPVSQNHAAGDTNSGGAVASADPSGGNAVGGGQNVSPSSKTDPHPSLDSGQVATTSQGASGGFNNSSGSFGGPTPKATVSNSAPNDSAHTNPTDTHTAPSKTTDNPSGDPKVTVSKTPDQPMVPNPGGKKPPAKAIDSDPFAMKTPAANPPVKTPSKTAPGKTADGRLTVPDAAAIAAAETDLTTTVPNGSVADLLQRVGQKPPAAEAYVALRKSLQLAINDGDAITALNVVDQLCHAFLVDELDVRARALTELRAKVREPAGCDAMGEAGLSLIDDAVAADNPQLAGQVAELALVAARRSGNNELIRKVTSRILKLRQEQPKAF